MKTLSFGLYIVFFIGSANSVQAHQVKAELGAPGSLCDLETATYVAVGERHRMNQASFEFRGTTGEKSIIDQAESKASKDDDDFRYFNDYSDRVFPFEVAPYDFAKIGASLFIRAQFKYGQLQENRRGNFLSAKSLVLDNHELYFEGIQENDLEQTLYASEKFISSKSLIEVSCRAEWYLKSDGSLDEHLRVMNCEAIARKLEKLPTNAALDQARCEQLTHEREPNNTNCLSTDAAVVDYVKKMKGEYQCNL